MGEGSEHSKHSEPGEALGIGPASMLDRNRSIRIIAAVATVAVIVLSIVIYRAEHNFERNAGTYDYASSAEYRTDGLCEGPNDIRSVSCVLEQIKANQQEKRAEYNLKAQQEMAEWAFAMFLTSVVGVVLVAFTLMETRGVLLEARKATDAANRTVDETRRIGDAQLRPYILSDGLEVHEHPHGGISIKPKWKNVGQTPTVGAVATHFLGTFETLPGDDYRYKTSDLRPLGKAAIGPGMTWKSIGPTVSSGDMLRVRNGKLVVIVWAFIEYSDNTGSGRRYRTEYCARVEYGSQHGYQWVYVQHGPFNGWDDECMYPPQTS